MTLLSLINAGRKIVFVVCLALAIASFVRPAQAEAPPKFAAPEVNEYVTKQTELMDTYIAALKEGDEAKKEESSKAMSEHADKNMFAIYDKVTAEEKPAYDKWVKNESDRMAEAILASIKR